MTRRVCSGAEPAPPRSYGVAAGGLINSDGDPAGSLVGVNCRAGPVGVGGCWGFPKGVVRWCRVPNSVGVGVVGG